MSDRVVSITLFRKSPSCHSYSDVLSDNVGLHLDVILSRISGRVSAFSVAKMTADIVVYLYSSAR